MKSLTHHKFNRLNKTLLLSSLLISSVAIAKPVQEDKKAVQNKTAHTKSKKTQAKTTKNSKTDKTNKTKAKTVKKPNKPAKKSTLKNHLAKNGKKTVVKKTTNTQKNSKKKGKKVLGADEISVEQLDLAKLSAGAIIKTTRKLVDKNVHTQTANRKVKTIVQNDNEIKELESKAKLSQQNTLSEQDRAGSELYMKGLQAYTDKNTEVAIDKLQQYVNDYPNGKLIAKVKYWLAESYLQKEPADYAKARSYFLEVADKYEYHPQNDKQSKALFRLSQLSKVNNYDDKLKKYTDILKKKYPNAEETKSALELLKSE